MDIKKDCRRKQKVFIFKKKEKKKICTKIKYNYIGKYNYL